MVAQERKGCRAPDHVSSYDRCSLENVSAADRSWAFRFISGAFHDERRLRMGSPFEGAERQVAGDHVAAEGAGRAHGRPRGARRRYRVPGPRDSRICRPRAGPMPCCSDRAARMEPMDGVRDQAEEVTRSRRGNARVRKAPGGAEVICSTIRCSSREQNARARLSRMRPARDGEASLQISVLSVSAANSPAARPPRQVSAKRGATGDGGGLADRGGTLPCWGCTTEIRVSTAGGHEPCERWGSEYAGRNHVRRSLAWCPPLRALFAHLEPVLRSSKCPSERQPDSPIILELFISLMNACTDFAEEGEPPIPRSAQPANISARPTDHKLHGSLDSAVC